MFFLWLSLVLWPLVAAGIAGCVLNDLGLLPATANYRRRQAERSLVYQTTQARTAAIVARYRMAENSHVTQMLALEAPKYVNGGSRSAATDEATR